LYAQQEAPDFATSKQKIVDEVYTSTDFLPLIDIEQANITLVDLSKSFQKMSDEYYEWDEKRQELEDEYGDIQIAIEHIIIDMDTTKTLIIDTLTKINLFKKKIKLLQENIVTLQGSLNDSKEYLRLYTTFLYKMNNDYYGKDLAINDVKLLVKSDNIADSLSADHLIQMLTLKLTVLLDAIRNQQVSYTKYVMELNKAKLAYQTAASSLKDELEDLQQQKQHFYELLSYLQSSRSEADEKIGLLRTSQDELEEQISYLRAAADFGNQTEIEEGSRLYELLNIKDRDDGDRYFSRPVLPITYVRHYYHDPYYFQEYKKEFEGLAVDVEQGSEVYAPAPGIVYRIHRSEDLSLSWMVLIHKHGYITFYKPLSEIYVEPGELIRRGQIIARTG
jgi:septal ring factor EnvC (AmiA/AmiB activator)